MTGLLDDGISPNRSAQDSQPVSDSSDSCSADSDSSSTGDSHSSDDSNDGHDSWVHLAMDRSAYERAWRQKLPDAQSLGYAMSWGNIFEAVRPFGPLFSLVALKTVSGSWGTAARFQEAKRCPFL